MYRSGILLAVLIFSGCIKHGNKAENINDRQEPDQPAALSLSGKEFYAPEFDQSIHERLLANLDTAKQKYDADPDDEMNIIWYGRRLAYLYRLPEAIEVFSQGLKIYPESYKLYRHRGHRYISTRQFDEAVNDLMKAAELMQRKPIEIEPDGQPNKLNIPLSTTEFNVWYHLGLAYYLQGKFQKAYDSYQECMDVSNNNDLLVATTDWLYMTCKRLGLDEEAENLLKPINAEMEIIENESYKNRLLMYKGLKKPEELLDLNKILDEDSDLALATQGYGVGIWFLYHGDTAQAIQVFQKVVEGKSWSAFGFIASEAELARIKIK